MPRALGYPTSPHAPPASACCSFVRGMDRDRSVHVGDLVPWVMMSVVTMARATVASRPISETCLACVSGASPQVATPVLDAGHRYGRFRSSRRTLAVGDLAQAWYRMLPSSLGKSEQRTNCGLPGSVRELLSFCTRCAVPGEIRKTGDSVRLEARFLCSFKKIRYGCDSDIW